MSSHNVGIGIALLGATLASIGYRYARRARRRLPVRGWVGLAVIAVALTLQFLRAPWWLGTYLTPIAWTGYLMLIDGAVESLGGVSRMTHARAEFVALCLPSIPLWVIFELYNLRLENWTYVGLPSNAALQALGYGWSFATIWPAIYETADLFTALGLFRAESAPRRPSAPAFRGALIAAGLVLLTAPVALPPRIGSYLFGAVWIGFIPLLDPILYAWRGPSLLREWEAGRAQTLVCFIAAGWVCGLLWEFFNSCAAARWVYIFPIAQHWKIFEMPVLGYLGFPAFAVECRVMWEFVRALWRRSQEPKGSAALTGKSGLGPEWKGEISR